MSYPKIPSKSRSREIDIVIQSLRNLTGGSAAKQQIRHPISERLEYFLYQYHGFNTSRVLRPIVSNPVPRRRVERKKWLREPTLRTRRRYGWLAVCVRTRPIDRDLIEICRDLIQIGCDIISTNHSTENWSLSNWDTSLCNHSQWHP